jgi:hypothetical protein
MLMRLGSIKFVLPTGCLTGGSKSSGGVAPSKPLGKLDGTALPQYKVEWSYHCDLVTLLLSQPVTDCIQKYWRKWKEHEQNEYRKNPKQILHYQPRGQRLIRRPMKRCEENVRL